MSEPDSNLPDADDPGKDRSGKESLIELVLIVAVALGLALLIQAFLVKPFRIPSPSMVPTLEIGERVLVNRLDGRFGKPERGDITVFKPPAGAEADAAPECGVADGEEYLPGKVYRSSDAQGEKMPCPKPSAGKSKENYIKRVVGLPGERLKIVRGHVFIDGKQLDEPYVNPSENCDQETFFSESCTFSVEITIPPGHYFMMGDNRNNSTDSRFWGPVPEDNIVGEAFATYWPPSDIGPL